LRQLAFPTLRGGLPRRRYSLETIERTAITRADGGLLALEAETEQDRPELARRRAQWKKYQGWLDPARLIFIDETWAKTI
jgi:hypothetical protein